MGRAEDRRARQRGGRRAAPRRSSGSPSVAGGDASATVIGTPSDAVGGRAAARRAARSGGRSGNGKGRIRRLFTWKKILGTFLGTCLLAIAAFIGLYLYVDVPDDNAAAQAAQRQSNVYKYSDGTTLARDGKVNREIVDLSKVPKEVRDTFVAAENKSFYNDNGIDLKGTARGVLNTLMGKGAQGGSTITQQYVKNYYLSQEQTVSRKLREIVISLKVDRQMSKDDILAGYINTSYYGRGAYGIQAAAQAYYRVDAEKLSVEQGAYLAALLQAPSQYDWHSASDTGRKLVTARWNYVLDNMVEEGWLDKAERQDMKFPKPEEPKPTAGREGQKGYLIELANEQLIGQLMKQEGIPRSQAEAEVVDQGWTITLNIDKKKQAQLEKAVKAQLTSKLDKKKRPVDADVQAGAVSVDPKTGKVVALYGGVDYFKHYTSNATRTDYQPASTFKPVILAAALEESARTRSGKPITANTIYDGTSKRQVLNADGDKVGFAPENEDDGNYGPITVQTAMNKSVNSVFAQMGVDVGMTNVMDVAGKLGMDTSKEEAVPAQTLGTMGASPLQMAGVYATLDNHGEKVTPSILKKAEHNSRAVDIPNPIGEQVISREAADTVTSVLTGVVDDGTAQRAVANNPKHEGQKVAGKTGTSDDNKSAWFTGYTPDLVTSVGLFGEDEKTHAQTKMYGAGGEERVNGGGFPAEIWAAYMFGVTDPDARFDLDTDQGAAVQPTWTPTPTQEPTTQEPTEEPTTQKPTETPTTEPPTETPTTEPPTEEPTTEPVPTAPTDEPTDPITLDPVRPDDDQ
ncbi:penicillin-binding protein [Streptomyces viridochromogenes]|uniref:Penicillin-binding protein n=1 Tax=Streptomyces viridochromogenes TaxID=1938 RepID=A0A0J7YVM8_STRVR|nr:transglycosylase domain-containing protein [Streptomyces viridochromogenes]KMS67564.1 penicillin-binding protein [Streptomyces viridochromogenes]KOG14060.1 penicillin-binding protein [Streptomyces viridochromogenes]KOG26863.1 penicillin-binding protein [Streptomyces viridochromogenes]